jgi:predicted nucleic acid-binding protein
VFLLDTDVISTTAPTKAVASAPMLDWLTAQSDFLYLSAITVAEIRRGIALASGKGHGRKADRLMEWQSSLVRTFGDRILPVDDRVASRAGDLLGAAESKGFSPGLPDACIAATADLHGFRLVTSNSRHFEALGVTCTSPWTQDFRS